MKNEAAWMPSKFVQTKHGLRASRNKEEVYVGSRISADGAAVTLEKAIEKHATGHLLDLGAGKAPLYSVYRPYVQEITCVDWKGTLHGTSYLDVTADLNKGIPFDDATFNTVLSTSVFEHLRFPHSIWRESARVLKPGGKLIVHVPFFYWLHEEPHDYFRYTEHALHMFCEENNLEVLSLESTGGGLAVVADLVARYLAPVAWLCALHVSISQWLIQSALGRKLSGKNRTRKMVLGYCLVAQKGS